MAQESDRSVHPGRARATWLKPSAEADRRILIRRLYFDLLGLPPRPEEVEAFVDDCDPAAYEHLVDRAARQPSLR